MKLLEPGAVVDGFVVRDCIHAGGMAHIYRVEYASGAPDPGFPMAMKIPRMTAGDGAENIVGFEVELQILPALTGPHVPRFVAAGDLHRLPYITMEYLQGHTPCVDAVAHHKAVHHGAGLQQFHRPTSRRWAKLAGRAPRVARMAAAASATA